MSSFVDQLKLALKEFYPQGPKASKDYGRIINKRQFDRLVQMIHESRGQTLAGGEYDEGELYIAPTIVKVTSPEDALIVEETFGPIIPILSFKKLDDAISIVNNVSGTPLGLYPFGTKQETDKILRETRSGGSTINDSFFHASIPTLAFGGVGESGQGAYRGRASFDCFTHRRSIVTTPAWMETLLAAR